MPVMFSRGTKRNPEAVFAAAVMSQLRMVYGRRMWETAFPGGIGSRAGIPDRLLCIDGHFVGIEFKSPNGTGRLGPKQQQELESLRQAGALVLVVSSANDLNPLFEAFPPTQGRLFGKKCSQDGSQE